MGMFDDLIPAQPAGGPAPAGAPPLAPMAGGGGLFDDLIPAAAPAAATSSGPQSAGDALDMVEGTGRAAYDTGPGDGLTPWQRVKGIGGATVAALDGAANAVPFTDRAAALAAAATGLGGKFGDYSGNLAQLRQEEGAAMEAHPIATVGGTLAGGTALALATGGYSLAPKAAGAAAEVAAPAARSLLARAGIGASTGAAVGGLQGVSASQDLTDPVQTAKDAGIGVGTGAFIGAAVPAVASGVGAAWRAMQPGASAAVSAVPGVSNTARDVMLGAIDKDGAANVQRNAALYGDAAMPFDYGTSLRGVAEGLATKDGAAASTIGDALGFRQAATNSRVRQGLVDNFGAAQDPNAVKAAIGDVQAAATTPLFARADAAGLPWSADADALMRRPAVASAMRGAAQDAANAGRPLPTMVLDEAGQPVGSDAALQAYSDGQRPGVTQALARLLGSDLAAQPMSLEDALVAQRSAAADPAYAAYRSMNVPMTPELADVLQRPSVASAIPAAERKAQDQGRSIFAGPAPGQAPAPRGAADIPDPFADLGAPYTVPPTQGQPSAQFGAPPRPTGPAPVSLTSFLQRAGGVQDPGGDLRSMGLDRFPGLVREGGMPLDRAREAAAEAGYLGGDTAAAMRNTTPNDLLDAMANHPAYSVHDGDAVAARQAWADYQATRGAPTSHEVATAAVRSHLVDSGVPAGSIDPRTLDVAAHFHGRGMEPGDAWEAATMSPPFPGDTPVPRGGAAPPTLEARTFAQAVPVEPGHQIVPINVDRADALWNWTPDYRIGPEVVTGSKLDRAKSFISGLRDGQDFKPPQLGVHDQGLGFDDGRNRFAAMRDLGFKTAPASMDPQSIAYAQRLGLIDEAPVAGAAVGPTQRQLTPEGLDYLKRTLGDRIDTARRAGERDDARVFTGLQQDLLGAIERHPDPTIADAYGAARRAYAGPSREIDALHAGRDAIADTVTPEAVQRQYGALQTDGERQRFRDGVFTALRDKLGRASDTADFVRTVAGNQALRDKFAAVAPHSGALDAFNTTMDRARQTFTEAQRPTPEAWRAALDRLDAQAAKGDAGAAAARDALAAHLGRNPDFARAREIQQGYGGLRDAVDYGRGSLAGGGDPVWPSGFAGRFAALSPAEQAAVRAGQRSLMEEAVGTKPNDQLAIKGLFQTGNTPGYTAPGVQPGAPDLSGWNAQKLATAFGEAPVGRMQELLNANDAMNSTFNAVAQNSRTARRQAMMEALADQEWQPRDLMKEGHGDDTLLGLGRTVLAKGVNAAAHAFQHAPSNAIRDADLARIGTLTGPERDAVMSQLFDRLPAYQGREAATRAAQDRALAVARLLAGSGAAVALNPSREQQALATALGRQ